jgi:hypothetical protein
MCCALVVLVACPDAYFVDGGLNCLDNWKLRDLARRFQSIRDTGIN